jgi:hypothetical protein
LKHSPIIRWKETLEDGDSWVNRGILIDTYYCTKEQDVVTVYWKFKGSQFTCPFDYKLFTRFMNYDFSVVVENDTKQEKVFAFTYDGIHYYYGNTGFELFLTENGYKYNIEESLKNKLIDFDDILNRATDTSIAFDGGTILYNYDNFNIIVCNTLDGNHDIIIGDTEMEIENYCQ